MGEKDNTKENNASTVVRVAFGENSVLFMGDAEGNDRQTSSSKPLRKAYAKAQADEQTSEERPG